MRLTSARSSDQAMSRDDVEALRQVYDTWARGDFRTGVDIYDPDVVWVLSDEFTVRNGEISEIDSYTTRAAALEAGGLSE